MSVPLPAVKGTTNLMVCLGQSWACAVKLSALRATLVRAIFKKCLRFKWVREVVFMVSPEKVIF
jgi:hypothetical protein